MKNNKLEGIDLDIEISLKEYGFAWKEQEKDYLFYYGINHNGEEFDFFDHGWFSKDIDILKEFDWVDWVDWENVFKTHGTTQEDWLTMSLPNQIYDLVNYYGYENIFGSSYWKGRTFSEIEKGNES